MKLSLKWINEFVDIADYMSKPRELAEWLIKAGLEVEQIEDPAGSFHHVVVGHIVELGKHPNADKLTRCQVDTGEKTHRQIVCGAKNHKQGDKVVVATPGAVLPGNFAIKISKIRGIESQGMLCSESELGFKEKSEGILILPKDAPIGVPFAEFQGLDDVIFDLSITPNRADCLSHLGLAREISCLLDRPLKPVSTKPKNTVRAGAGKSGAKNKVAVEVRDSELCPRYSGQTIFGVKVGPSPAWLKQRLESLGVNSVNNVVDVTNYVMLERGQPLHAFDLAQLRGQKITVARSTPNEKFKTFDGTELTLSGEELTIRDNERAVALAGVIGGVNSGVSNSTRDVFLEAAYFNPKGVRRTSRRLAVDTDSAYRFARGVDINGVIEAMARASELLCELAGGESSADHVDVYPKPAPQPRIVVRQQKLSERLGYEVKMADFVRVVKRLHCTVKDEPKAGAGDRVTGEQVNIVPPSFRVDLEIEMDLVEEYGRLNGYDKIPETFPVLRERPTDHAASYVGEERVRDQLVREGFFEARNYAFLSPKWQSEFVDSTGAAQVVRVRNPLSEETSAMRMSLLPGLVQNLIYNEHRGLHFGRLFEAGRVFVKEDSPTDDKGDYLPVPGFHEPHRLALIAWGHCQGLWQKSTHPVVYDLKSALVELANSLGGRIEVRSGSTPAFLHPGQSAQLFNAGRAIGFFGSLHPQIRDRYKIRSDTAVAELDLGALLHRVSKAGTKVKAISKFPSVERDFSLVVSDSVIAGDIVRETEKVAGALLQEVEVFDVFRGTGVAEGHQSVSIRVVLQDIESTLSEERLQAFAKSLLERLEQKFAAKIR